MPYVIFSVICLIWGASFILMKKAALAFGPISIGAIRVTCGALVLGALWRFARRSWPVTRGHIRPIMLVVLMGYALPFTIQPYLVSRHGSGFIGMMVSLVPLMTLIISVPMLGLWPTRRQIVGVIGGLACIAAILADGVDRAIPVGDLCLAVSVPLMYATTNIYVKKRLADLPAMAFALAALVLAAALLLPLSVAMPSEKVTFSDDLGLAVAAVLALGAIGTGVAHFMFYHLVRHHGPLFAGMVTYLVPLGAIVWGWLDAEAVTARQLIALAGIFVMVAIVQYRAAQPPLEVAE